MIYLYIGLYNNDNIANVNYYIDDDDEYNLDHRFRDDDHLWRVLTQTGTIFTNFKMRGTYNTVTELKTKKLSLSTFRPFSNLHVASVQRPPLWKKDSILQQVEWKVLAFENKQGFVDSAFGPDRQNHNEHNALRLEVYRSLFFSVGWLFGWLVSCSVRFSFLLLFDAFKVHGESCNIHKIASTITPPNPINFPHLEIWADRACTKLTHSHERCTK